MILLSQLNSPTWLKYLLMMHLELLIVLMPLLLALQIFLRKSFRLFDCEGVGVSWGKTDSPERPFAVILGGAKVSDKITVIDKLIEKAERNHYRRSNGLHICTGKWSRGWRQFMEPDKVELAKKALEKAKERGVRFLLQLIPLLLTVLILTINP